MGAKSGKKTPAYQRVQGNRQAKEKKGRTLSFSLREVLPHVEPGQTAKEWEEEGLLSLLYEQIRYISQFTCQEALQNGCIKRYTKVGYPPNSEYKKPQHINAETWAVMHITKNSKQVVAGYIQDDVFFIVFLDKEHQFWPMAGK
ncbi:hypothetical protein [[Flexibacter] sp. ATCC 35208]|uniref:hypothetical protein n=1 Tax=[Flexibacter] sp. ATCC 35208 TaxID=1936242 RepID=UPI0009CB7D0A|nr:hypothetical protein [[Flexibacter] sp. ATCC 35208]OMP76764.1 hypothetical protein BW716_23515 [[Flexibacter] sp. ATCC 35208]